MNLDEVNQVAAPVAAKSLWDLGRGGFVLSLVPWGVMGLMFALKPG